MRIEHVAERLAVAYPEAVCELDYRTPWELLVATVLSAQCTDLRVNQVTPEIFSRWPGPAVDQVIWTGTMCASPANPAYGGTTTIASPSVC